VLFDFGAARAIAGLALHDAAPLWAANMDGKLLVMGASEKIALRNCTASVRRVRSSLLQ
jgi:hypothetical protein